LVKVKKRPEEFNKAKLKASIKNAGVKDKHATQIADKIASKVKEGTTTVLIKRWVITELKPLDAKAAEAYTKYKKPPHSIRVRERPRPSCIADVSNPCQYRVPTD
jgi:2-phosphoglycerate kinase